MKYRIHGIRLRYNRDGEQAIRTRLLQHLRISEKDLLSVQVARRSVDARKKPVNLVYSLDVETAVPLSDKVAGKIPEPVTPEFESGATSLSDPPVVVGAGPAGLFAGYILAKHGYRPIILERGGNIDERNVALTEFARTRDPNPDCNVLFGIGGAGTFSDGKLTTSLTHPLISHILHVLVECGAPTQILTDAKPHIGTDVLQKVVTNLVNRIEALGGTIRTGVTVTGMRHNKGRISGVETSDGHIDAGTVVMATGHSARDTWKMLEKAGVELAPKPFQMGIRVDHPQSWLDRQQYGEGAGHPALGAAEYKVSTRVEGIPVFSFCMCPGGWTIPTVNEPGNLCVNGMSLHKREGQFSSSGIVVTMDPTIYGGNDLDSCLAYVRTLEARCFERGGADYTAPAQTLKGFLRGEVDSKLPTPSYEFGVVPAPLDELLPDYVSDKLRRAIPVFDRNLPGFVQDDAMAVAPEARASSPVRIVRDKESRQSSSIEGLYPAGEGSGYAGGIISAALDGLNAGIKIIEGHAPK